MEDREEFIHSCLTEWMEYHMIGGGIFKMHTDNLGSVISHQLANIPAILEVSSGSRPVLRGCVH